MFVVRCVFCVVCCFLVRVGCRMLDITRCVLLVVCCLLRVVRSSVSVVWCLLCVVCCFVLDVSTILVDACCV